MINRLSELTLHPIQRTNVQEEFCLHNDNQEVNGNFVFIMIKEAPAYLINDPPPNSHHSIYLSWCLHFLNASFLSLLSEFYCMFEPSDFIACDMGKDMGARAR